MSAPKITADNQYPRLNRSATRSPAAVPSAKVNKMASQYQASRGRLTMLWIDSVPSRPYQITKVIVSAAANTTVVNSSGTPSASVRLSVISVPTTEINTTTDQ